MTVKAPVPAGTHMTGRYCVRRVLAQDRTLKPVFAALLLGAVVALSLTWTQMGIHVAGVFSLLFPAVAENQASASHAGFCSVRSFAANKGWVGWMVFGILAGAAATSFWRKRGLRFEIERGRGVRPVTRLTLAGGGGLLVGVGAALAGGCTSSIGLTGGALLSVAGFAFLGVFFVGGFVARVFFGRFWNV
jgi:hypothetical protein